MVDTCAAEFEAHTPYYYSTYGAEDEVKPQGKGSVVVFGSGPIRIGQGIEFDYCSVHASWALKRQERNPSSSTTTPKPYPLTLIPPTPSISNLSPSRT